MGLVHMSSGLILSSFFNHVLLLLLCFGSHGGSLLGAAAPDMGRNMTDQLALLEFKAKITDDPLGVMSSWNDSIHFCQWQGVICSHRRQRVTVLDLQSRKLAGFISPHIGNLSFLRVLRLQNNSFSHEIPPEVGRLSRLQKLQLDNNSISGEIPANISCCSNLIVFRFSNNKLVGKLPVELSSLSKLRFIAFRNNHITGQIPSSFGNLSSLRILSAPLNYLDGSIPDALGQLTKLTYIALGGNLLSGNIPSLIFNRSSLRHLDVAVNNIQGSLPSDLGITLPYLSYLNIAVNQFTGSIPVSISNASNLALFVCTENGLTGKVPTLEKLHKLQFLSITSNLLGSGEADDLGFLSSLINATSLKLLDINNNSFGGVLPKSIGNLSVTLATLLLDGNQIFGSIPTGISNLVNLERLHLWNNQFSGNIPSDLGKIQKLRELDFRNNQLSGSIPSSLGNLTLLNYLYLDINNLQGSIPSSLGKCQNLIYLSLSQNNLSGSIPRQVVGLPSLSILLDLSQNHLTGPLPMEVGNLINLGALDISDNLLSGEVPSSLGSCIKLEILGLSENFFQGTIPSSIRSLRGIQILDLSHNNLSGTIPQFLGSFKFLQDLNLSYNGFEGPVPIEGVFKNATATSVTGNSNLCGGIPEFQLPRCSSKDSKKRRTTLPLKLIVPIISGLLGVTLLLSLLFLCWLRKKRKRKELISSSSGISLLQVSYQNLLRATNGFSSANLIGVGSFGSVYKGVLDQDGAMIAVKVLNLLRPGASKSFKAECEALRSIRHRNLVKVLTACSGVDYRGNDFKALVYEFMVNGSLEDWLHTPCDIVEAHEAPRYLNLLQRLNIAIDIASALDYLHHQCQTPIIHCDLKPSNVLLDDEMTGHVGDFGLARFLPEVTNNFSANQSSSIGIRGSVGYTAPEYGLGSEVSTYGDVYSFGILLLEVFTGKRPTDEMFNDSLNLRNYIQMALPEQVAGIVDPILLQAREDEETGTSANSTRNQLHVRTHKIQECLVSIVRIGIVCSAESPRERMDISDVAAELHLIRGKLLGNGPRGQR